MGPVVRFSLSGFHELPACHVAGDKSYHFPHDSRIPEDAPLAEAVGGHKPGAGTALCERSAVSPRYDLVMVVMDDQRRMVEARCLIAGEKTLPASLTDALRGPPV